MDLPTLTRIFMWCTIINGALLLLWISIFALDRDLVYRTQTRWFPITQETFVVVFYSFLGVFKIFFLVFNLVPYVALLIVGGMPR